MVYRFPSSPSPEDNLPTRVQRLWALEPPKSRHHLPHVALSDDNLARIVTPLPKGELEKPSLFNDTSYVTAAHLLSGELHLYWLLDVPLAPVLALAFDFMAQLNISRNSTANR